MTDDPTRRLSVHRLVSIGLSMSYEPDSELENVYLERKTMNADDLKDLIRTFRTTLKEFRDKAFKKLPGELKKGLKALLEFKKTQHYKSSSPNEKTKIDRQLKFLKNMAILKCYTWNGEKYDHNVIIAPLVHQLLLEKKRIDAIKRGSGFMQIIFDGICLRDMINFSAPIRLGLLVFLIEIIFILLI